MFQQKETDMKNQRQSLVELTSWYSFANESWKPVTSLSINERISYRASDWVNKEDGHVGFHHDHWNKTLSREERLIRYETTCLEWNMRPYTYSDEMWEEHLRDCQEEEFYNNCEAANAWMYEL